MWQNVAVKLRWATLVVVAIGLDGKPAETQHSLPLLSPRRRKAKAALQYYILNILGRYLSY